MDNHSDGTSKAPDFLAALALKTATSRSGVQVSPYNNANKTGGKAFDYAKLNQCEPGYNTPDLASKGTINNGLLLDLSAAPWYRQNCSWASDWGVPELTPLPISGTSCSAFPIGTGANEALMGLNLYDAGTARRCPSIATCQPGQACCLGRFATSDFGTCTVKTDGTVWCFGGSSPWIPTGPVAVAGGVLDKVLEVAVGSGHVCATLRRHRLVLGRRRPRAARPGRNRILHSRRRGRQRSDRRRCGRGGSGFHLRTPLRRHGALLGFGGPSRQRRKRGQCHAGRRRRRERRARSGSGHTAQLRPPERRHAALRGQR